MNPDARLRSLPPEGSHASFEAARQEAWHCLNGPPSRTPAITLFDAASVKKNWARLHAGDAEPLPQGQPRFWRPGRCFTMANSTKPPNSGLKLGGAGITVANKASAIYANYLEPKEKTKLDLFMEVAQRAETQAAEEPKNANAYYWQAYALGRLQPGHQRGQGAGARPWQPGQGGAGTNHQAGAPGTPTPTLH